MHVVATLGCMMHCLKLLVNCCNTVDKKITMGREREWILIQLGKFCLEAEAKI